MQPSARVHFPPFQLDATNEQLWRTTSRGAEALRLRPKTFAVLRYLIEHHQQLVTKDQLLSALWPGTWVTDSALKSCVRELHGVLNDTPKAPRFIETVHRRGYRFVAALTTAQPVVSGQFSVSSSESGSRGQQPNNPGQQLTTDNWQLITRVVGRENELMQLHRWLEKAQRGERQIVFVAGEPGIGKTALVGAFLTGVRDQGTGISSPSTLPTFSSLLTGSRTQHAPIGPQSPVPTPNPQHRPCGSDKDSASSTTALVSRICRYSRHWDGCVENQQECSSSTSLVNMPQPGSCKCPHCCRLPNWRSSNAKSRGQPRSACCGRWRRQ